jgi:hypothetical protein
VTIGEHLDKTFSITNTGGGTLSGSVSETCDHYEITAGGGAYALAADESVVVTVRFEPTAGDTQLCTIETGTDCSNVSCTGVGYDPSFVKEPAIPSVFRLAQNSPNPFVGATQIMYQLPVDCHMKLEIYTVLGRKVATLVDQHQSAGYRSARWDAVGDDGTRLPGGIYLCRMEAPGYVRTTKMILLK